MQTKKLKDIWNTLPDIEHTKKYTDEKSGLRMYEVIGKKFQETASVEYVLNILKKAQEQYGKRAIEAAQNKNIDWKAVSHAIRAAYQVKQLLTENTITFPLREAPYILDVKLGKKDYLTDVSPTLENLIDEVELLTVKSTLPEKADRNFWNNWLMTTVEEEIF